MIYRFEDLEVDTVALAVRRAGVPVVLKPRPFALLEYLIVNADRVVSKEEVVREIWEGRAVSDGAIATAVRDVRKAIGDDNRDAVWLRTFYGRGLRWMASANGNTAPLASSAEARDAERARVVAVMPFDCLSSDPADDRVARFLGRDVIARLSRFGVVRVLSEKYVQACLADGESDLALAARMGAHYVVEASLWRSISGIELDVQIGEAATGTQLWADRYELPTIGSKEDLDDLAAKIVAPLVPAINANEAAKARHLPLDQLTPVGCFYRGRALVHTWDPEVQDTAIDLLERALAEAPDFAMAYAALSSAMCIRAMRFREEPSAKADLVDQARSMAEKAMEIELDMPYGWAALARCHMAAGDLEEAALAAQKAVALNPLLTSGHLILGHILWQIDRTVEAIEAFDTGLRFGYRDVYRPGLLGGKACALVLGTNYEEAIHCSREAQREPGASHFTAVGEICGLHYLGRQDEAVDAFARARRRYADFGSALMLSTFPMPNQNVRARILKGIDGASYPHGTTI